MCIYNKIVSTSCHVTRQNFSLSNYSLNFKEMVREPIWISSNNGSTQNETTTVITIFLKDLFLFVKEASICNFGGHNSLYTHAKTLAKVISTLELETVNLLQWFKLNSIAANPVTKKH